MSPALDQDIADLAARWEGRPDGFVDSFRIQKAATGPLRGDCDDYAVTALWLVSGRSMRRFWWLLLTGTACIWRSYSPRGVRHAVLWVDGFGYIDNLNPAFAETTPHTLRHRRWTATIALKMLVGRFA